MDPTQEHLTTPPRPHAGNTTMTSPYTPTDLNVYPNTSFAAGSPSPSHLAPPYQQPPTSAGGTGGNSDFDPSPAGSARSTPSPLPSLGELRQLHRANSAAGRLVAMKKLMGEAPPSPTALQRAGSLGSSTMLDSSEMSPSKRRRRVGMMDAAGPGAQGLAALGNDEERMLGRAGDDDDEIGYLSSQPLLTTTITSPSTNNLFSISPPPPSVVAAPSAVPSSPPQQHRPPFIAPQARPRLGRSNTVGTGGGEERRSVIGRRMMQRLGNRVAAQQVAGAGADDGDTPPPVRPNPFAVLERRMQLAAQQELQQQQQHHPETPPAALDDQQDFFLQHRSTPTEVPVSVSMDRGLLADTSVSSTPERRRPSATAEAITLGGAWASSNRPPIPAIPETEALSSAALLHPPFPSAAGGTGGLSRSNSAASAMEDPLLRTASRQTARSEVSAGDLFEYEAHLKRSLSERRAGGGGSITPTGTLAGESAEGYAGVEDLVDDGTGGPGEMAAMGSPDRQAILRSIGYPPSTPGRFADAEEAYRLSQMQPMPVNQALANLRGMHPAEKHQSTSTGTSTPEDQDPDSKEDDLLPPLAPFAAYDFPHRPSHQQPTLHHGQSPSASSINSTTDPMSKVPFIIPGSGMSPSADGRQERAERARLISRGGDNLSNYPGEAVSEQGSSGYDQKSGVLSVFPASPPATAPLAVHAELATEPAEEEKDGDYGDTDKTPVVGRDGMERWGERSANSQSSQMSWEEVSTPQEPDVKRRKSDAIASKIKGTFRRNRSASRDRDGEQLSPAGRSPSGTRNSQAESNHSGSRESHLGDGDHHRSLSASRKGSLNSSVMSQTPSLLPHGQLSPLPLAEANDPRLRNSKLFPSPGVPPPLLQQVSDSVIPALQNEMASPSESTRSSLNQNQLGAGNPASPASGALAYYDLPPRAQSPTDGASVGKKSWLAEAFFAPTGTTFLSKRRPSIPEIVHRRPSEQSQTFSPPTSAVPTFPGSRSMEREDSNTSEHLVEMRAPSPGLSPSLMSAEPRAPKTSPHLLMESPAMSTVMELGEDGLSTMYRPNSSAASTHLGVNPSPVTMSDSGVLAASIKGKPVAPATSQVLQRLDGVLALSVDDPNRPDVLDDPPRRLALSTPVLQVVNGHTVKDRHLFLFSDILVIAKPLTSDEGMGSLDDHFAVKSVVSLQDLNVLATPGDERTHDTGSTSKHPVVANFIESFRKDPAAAVKYLVQRSQLQDDHVTLASLLFKSSELDKEQLGRYLAEASSNNLLKSFVNRFHFSGIRVDEALRTFLLAVRLPTEAVASERLLAAFAYGWHHVNSSSVAFSTQLTNDLVLAIMQLNDALNPNTGFGYFAFANQVIGVDDFVMAFRAKDVQSLVPQALLESVYTSIRREKLVQAVKTGETDTLREVLVTPTRLPTRLTHNTWSERIYISIPAPDARFGVKLHGEGLLFDPPFLDFTNSTEESFRVMGSSLGPKSMLFSRTGSNAPLYSNLPNTKTFVVERSFMRHTFQVSFLNHVGTKRKYCFSVEDSEMRDEWMTGLSNRIAKVNAEKASMRGNGIMSLKARLAAEAVSLKVLQDTLIPNDDEMPAPQPKRKNGKQVMPDRKGSVSVRYPVSDDKGGEPAPAPLIPGPRLLSPTSSSAGRRTNTTLGDLIEGQALVAGFSPAGASPSVTPAATPGAGAVERNPFEEPLPPKAQTGKDIVLICRQNSLLPVVLGFLHVGSGAEGHGQAGYGGGPVRRTAIPI